MNWSRYDHKDKAAPELSAEDGLQNAGAEDAGK